MAPIGKRARLECTRAVEYNGLNRRQRQERERGEQYWEGSGDVVRFGIIMAGGSGERFWPLSRRNHPKQLLRLTHPENSMLAEAVALLKGTIPAERLYVVTGRHLVEPIRAAKVGLPEENILGEPCKRNTSGALAYAAAYLMAANPEVAPDDMSLAITTADHFIGDLELFGRTLETAMATAEEQGGLVTCGIVPSRPETGFGYIQIAEGAAEVACGHGDIKVHPVAAFHEKPDRDTAQSYVASGRFFWNSGMFFWKVSSFLEELAHACPALGEAVGTIANALKQADADDADEIFKGLENTSIDFVLMEKARQVYVVQGTFPWDDVGSWPSLGHGQEEDAQGNLIAGDAILHEVSDCVVYNACPGEDMAVGVVGVEGLAVVVTKDAVLVVPKDRAQEVRHIVGVLKERKAKQL